MKIQNKWLIWLAITTFPVVLLIIAGIVWLFQHDYILIWLSIAAITAGCGWIYFLRIKKTQAPSSKSLIIHQPDTWSTEAKNAWKTVEEIALRISQQKDLSIIDWSVLWDILKEVMQAVSKHFNPDIENAVLELKVPDLMHVIELLSRDLQVAFTENVPGSHIFTVNDVIRGHRMATRGKKLYDIYRIFSFGVNPVTSVVREMQRIASTEILDHSLTEAKQWLVNAYIKKIGYYAIELYSGQLVLHQDQLISHTTPDSRKDIIKIEQREKELRSEPLRILVFGQVNSGKSSLINALFGEVKAMVDVLPETSQVVPYMLEREGIQRAIVLDTAGYESTDHVKDALESVRREILKIDLLILVCSAQTASRHADKQLLLELNDLFLKRRGIGLPPLIVALTHIDRLRPFRYWYPPYNISNPDTEKARNIKTSLETVASELELDSGQVVPICLKKGFEYNIEEALIPAILELLDESLRLKYLRCLKSYRAEEAWRQLWLQATNTGRIVMRKGKQWLLGG
ncbi:MAG: 50S ribosome-binding GTPase [Desulfobacterales bacterium]|nr:50S ribosome-binding GTPase [Desulfobacterales bacterium]